ncbi:HD domain-containing protein [Patescibacteria group bacterium]
MIVTDRVYGNVRIEKRAVLELLADASMQRLKHIDQAGYFEPFWDGTKHTRYEHSLGVYILLKKYKAPVEEQIAGLLHDVSHAAFSHCIDYVLDEGSPEYHDHQDNIFKKFVLKTNIPKILKKYGFDPDYILNEENFPLKEKDLPDLCADRIDYFLRTAVIIKKIDNNYLKNLFSNLITENNNWIFKDFKTAKDFAKGFYNMNKDYYAGLSSATMFQTVADFLKHGLSKDYINKKNLYTTDDKVLKKIKKHLKKDKKLNILWLRMNNIIKAKNNPKNFHHRVLVKSRIIDPLFISKRKTIRLSDHLKSWRKTVETESLPKEYFLQFEK